MANSTENDNGDMRALLDLYQLAGFSRTGLGSVTRLAAELHSSDARHIALRRADIRWLLSWLDELVMARRREVPTLEISDSQYYRVVGRHITAARERRGITQAELGRAISADVRTVSAYERASRDPALWRLRRIAAALAVPIGSLATEREPGR